MIFKVLAKCKWLRGTAFDPFGYTNERKQERGLIKAYEANIEMVIHGLNRDNHRLGVDIAAAPENIRGFGHVKEANIERSEACNAVLLERFQNLDLRESAAE